MDTKNDASWDKNEVFTIECKMRERWVPHFLAMLHTMQQYGELGCSRMLSFYADGDEDFSPKFQWAKYLCCHAEPIKNDDGHKTFDAG